MDYKKNLNCFHPKKNQYDGFSSYKGSIEPDKTGEGGQQILPDWVLHYQMIFRREKNQLLPCRDAR